MKMTSRLISFAAILSLSFSFLGATVLSGCVAKKDLSARKSLISEPVLDPKLSKEDFAFPSRPPRLSRGKVVFEQNCASCHGMGSLTYDQIKDRKPIDQYLMLTRGEKGHAPGFRNLDRDARWEALFYARYLAGGAEIKNDQIAEVYGSNCAVCHGTQGFADGPLYTGHASAHELGMAPVKNAFYPPPANFHSYSRLYNRTDDQLHKYIVEGIYPSAMPSWKGREDKDKGVVFDDALIRDLVLYVRKFAYEDDLPQNASGQSGAEKEKEISAAINPSSDRLEKHK